MNFIKVQIALIRRKWSYKKRRNIFVSESKSSPLPVRSSRKVHYELDLTLKNQKPKSKFLTWLHNQTSCQVNFKWIDLGIRYYPRYLARGSCDHSRQGFGIFYLPNSTKVSRGTLIIYNQLELQNVEPQCQIMLDSSWNALSASIRTKNYLLQVSLSIYVSVANRARQNKILFFMNF